MTVLTRTEEMILLAIYQLDDNAYGITIRNSLQEYMRKKFSIGAIYIPLERLTKKGILKAYKGESTGERGGRKKRLFKITSKGILALKETKELHDTMWNVISEDGLKPI